MKSLLREIPSRILIPHCPDLSTIRGSILNTPSQVTQKIATRAGESSYNATQYLVQGTYRLIIMAPFNTQMGAIPLNPPAGLQFLPDQDPTRTYGIRRSSPLQATSTLSLSRWTGPWRDRRYLSSSFWKRYATTSTASPPDLATCGGSATGMEQSVLPGCNPATSPLLDCRTGPRNQAPERAKMVR